MHALGTCLYRAIIIIHLNYMYKYMNDNCDNDNIHKPKFEDIA